MYSTMYEKINNDAESPYFLLPAKRNLLLPLCFPLSQRKSLNFKLVNEYNQPILDAPDFLLQLQISVFDKDNNYFKEAMLQGLKLLNEIYFLLI